MATGDKIGLGNYQFNNPNYLNQFTLSGVTGGLINDTTTSTITIDNTTGDKFPMWYDGTDPAYYIRTTIPNQPIPDNWLDQSQQVQDLKERIKELEHELKKLRKKKMKQVTKRLVQVFVVDPDKRVDDEHSVVHKSEVMVSSKTNEELFYDVDWKAVLAAHNTYRASVVHDDRSEVRGKDIHLKPVKVSDLERQVVVLANF